MKKWSLVVCVTLIQLCSLWADENGKGLKFNFRGVPLDTVLEYLAKSGDFVIVKNVEVNGTIDMFSHREVSRDEAIQILGTVLHTKGYGVVRRGETLVIVPAADARQADIPVVKGNDPNEVDASDVMVTQVIPIKFLEVKDLVKNLTPLLPTNTSITSNESSNSLILTDTKSNIFRVLKVIQALDTSVVENSKVVVFSLQFAQAKGMAEIIEKLFTVETTSGKQGGRDKGSQGGPSGFMQRMMEMRSGRSKSDGSGGSSGAVNVNSERVMVVADEETNSIVVRATENTLDLIEELIKDLDEVSEDKTLIRVVSLENADPSEMADLINGMFNDQQSSSRASQSSPFGSRSPFFSGFSRGGDSRGGDRKDSSKRTVSSETVIVQADLRTKSVLISAPGEMMEQILGIIEHLDQIPAKKQSVKVYPIKHVNVEELAAILETMFVGDSSTSTRTSSSRNTTSGTASSQLRSQQGFSGFQGR